jgi:hypothetical protein
MGGQDLLGTGRFDLSRLRRKAGRSSSPVPLLPYSVTSDVGCLSLSVTICQMGIIAMLWLW